MKTEITKHPTKHTQRSYIYKPEFLHLSSRDILGQIIFMSGGTVLCVGGCLTASQSTYYIPVASFSPSLTPKSRLCQMSSGRGTYICVYRDLYICMYISAYIYTQVSVTSHLYLPGTFNFLNKFVNFQSQISRLIT